MTKRKTNRVPLGTVKLLTDEEIDEYAATVTPADIELMRARWKKYASRRYADLIDATPVEPFELGQGDNIE